VPLYHFNCSKQLEFFYVIKSNTVGSVGEAVKKTKVFTSKKRKQTTGGSRGNIDSYENRNHLFNL